MKQHIQMGNTVRLTAQFSDWDGNPVDPALIKVKFYDTRFKLLEEHSVGAANKLDVGSYYFDYVPQVPDTIYYEWYAEIDGLPSLKRESLTVRKI
jgi:hypothetical protein